MYRMLAILERELRRFRRSPALIMMSLVMPIAQLVVLGYAFGGQVRNLKLGVVNQDHRLPSVKLSELCLAVTANARTFETIDYSDAGEALADLRNGKINGVLTIPAGFSQRVIDRNDPRVALIEDNTDGFRASAMVASVTGLMAAYNQPAFERHLAAEPRLDVVEAYPYVPYVQYLLPRAMFGILNTFLFFPSGAVYPQEAFPGWMQVIAKVDPMTYIVHALKNLMLKNTTFAAITFDLAYLLVFTAVAMTAATLLFKRTL